MNATLNDVIEELKASRTVQDETRESIEVLVGAVRTHFQMLSDQFERDRLQAEEDRRERQGREREYGPRDLPPGLPGPVTPTGPLDMLQSVFGGTFLGNFTTGLFKALIFPLKNIMKLLRVGGPVALAVGALWYVLDGIGNNPKLKSTLESISNLWNNELVPLVDDFASMIARILGNEEVGTTLEFIKWGWENFSNWFTGTFKPLFQGAFLDAVTILIDTISGFIDGIRQMTKGEFLAGLQTIISSLTTGVFNALDNAISFLIEVLGFDLGPEGSLVAVIKDTIPKIIQYVKDGFTSIQLFFSETIPQWFQETKDFVTNKFWEIIELTKQKIIEKFEELDISGRIAAAIEAIKGKFDQIIQGFTDMIDYVVSIPGRVRDYVTSFLPDWLSWNSTPALEPQLYMKPEDSVIIPRDTVIDDDVKGELRDYLNGISSNSANRLEVGTKAILDNKTNGGGVAIMMDNRRNSNVSSATTTIMAFPSPMADFQPI